MLSLIVSELGSILTETNINDKKHVQNTIGIPTY